VPPSEEQAPARSSLLVTWWLAGVEPLEEVIADAQRVGYGGKRRVHRARGGEEAVSTT
jgi:hypothetical protein